MFRYYRVISELGQDFLSFFCVDLPLLFYDCQSVEVITEFFRGSNVAERILSKRRPGYEVLVALVY